MSDLLTQTGSFLITNTGTEDLVVSSVVTGCPNPVVNPPLPFTVPVGEAQVFTATAVACELFGKAFTVTTSCGVKSGTWPVADGGGGGGECNVTISNSLAGDGSGGLTNLASFVINNNGTNPVEVTGIDWLHSDTDTFTPPFPFTVEPSSSVAVSVSSNEGGDVRCVPYDLLTSCGTFSGHFLLVAPGWSTGDSSVCVQP